MDSIFWRRTGRLWIQGGVLLLLRLWQNRVGFDADTGLARPSFPETALVVLLVLFAGLELAQALAAAGGKGRRYAALFDPPERSLPAAAAGCLLLAGGGALLLASALTEKNVIAAAAGALGAAAGVGLLRLLRQARAGETLSVLPALPAMFFGVLLVLTVYLPTESDPVLARSFLPVLAAAATACAFSQLGGFLRADGSVRMFLFTGDLAVVLCLAAIADGEAPLGLLYAGCALTLSVFLALRRQPPRQPEQTQPREEE